MRVGMAAVGCVRQAGRWGEAASTWAEGHGEPAAAGVSWSLELSCAAAVCGWPERAVRLRGCDSRALARFGQAEALGATRGGRGVLACEAFLRGLAGIICEMKDFLQQRLQHPGARIRAPLASRDGPSPG